MQVKRVSIKKGFGGSLEEVVRNLLPTDTGYVEVQHDVAHKEHPTHTHPTDEILHILEGSVYFTADGETVLCEAGDRIFLPSETVHSSKAGPDGCVYVISILKN
ncbi:cupin domain-containing protein [Priestia koreensis]|uniref:Cupin n=1 Tax=Priestia koreensis TaxID=284581 RepID=A0A0M0L8Z1_9BACI|nr:cupin domain-containing protein [Priestia koreensis]KOO47489.1 cupin [Priestia koreensis]MCM3006972.1 cupin domain-containing protein [Priestia koreensis]UNL86930.1 cupin domain-containing protein [Priestia koreensis]